MKVLNHAVLPAALLFGAALGFAAAPAHATVTIVDNGATAPLTTTAVIYQANNTGNGSLNGYQDYTNQQTVGEAFTPLTTFTLGSLTLEGVSGGGGLSATTTDFTLSIYSNPVTNQLASLLGSYTAPIGTIATNNADYFTFSNLQSVNANGTNSPLVLTAGTQYEFGLSQTGPGYLGIGRSSTQSPAVGASFNQGNYLYSNPATTTPSSVGGYDYAGVTYDRTFFIASAAPEPSEIGMLAILGFCLGGLLLRARKNRNGVNVTA